MAKALVVLVALAVYVAVAWLFPAPPASGSDGPLSRTAAVVDGSSGAVPVPAGGGAGVSRLVLAR